MSKNYITDIGLEVHVELDTRSKMFCGCAVVDASIAEPNSSVCEVCTGMPGVLPVINERAIEMAIQAGLALNCTINKTSIFARKNYFYPDLPKGYQISQYEHPLAIDGMLTIQTDSGKKDIRIWRAHLEEDTGKLTHIDRDGDTYSLVDLNRAGIPLLEIVSEPDMHSVEDVRSYSQELRMLLRWIGVTSGDMEKGSMRFEANVSMRPDDSEELGTRVEIKNLNSFRAMEHAIAYALVEQQKALAQGNRVKQQTLGWNEHENRTYPQRTKEEANDYRYFPEPDLPPLVLDADWIAHIRSGMPELPNATRVWYKEQSRLAEEDIERLLDDRAAAQFFEDCLTASPQVNPRAVVNWMLTDLYAWLNQKGLQIVELGLNPKSFTELVWLVENGTINQTTAKEVLVEMLETEKSAAAIIAEKGLEQISDSNVITSLVKEVLMENPRETQSFRDGKETIANWLFGQVMKKARGQANPKVLREELHRQLGEE